MASPNTLKLKAVMIPTTMNPIQAKSEFFNRGRQALKREKYRLEATKTRQQLKEFKAFIRRKRRNAVHQKNKE